jgi:choline dehydrogenase-like flavoprotein
VGLEYRTAAGLQRVNARREVLVCGGAFNSPQLLQLSGLGPAAELQKHQIPVIRDMPGVGSNLQDHPHLALMYRCTAPITVNDTFNSYAARVKAAMQYLLFRSGPMSANAVYAGGFFKSVPQLDRPDIQIVSRNWSTGPRVRAMPQVHPFSGFMIGATHLRPHARGTVRLKSPDPMRPPAITFNFFKDQYDRDAVVTGFKLVRQLAAMPALKRYIKEEVMPGKDVRSEDEILEFCRQGLMTVYHPAGTCRMGTDPLAVVDPRLRVHGIDRLRVIDTSIMPNVVAGNTNAPAMMIGEKASDMILEDAR